MPTLAGELQTHTEDAASCVGLPDFRCGDGRLRAEAAVEEIIEEYRSGEDLSVVTRVTRELPSGAIVGIAGIKRRGLRLRHPRLQEDAYQDAALMEVVALNAPYRGRYETRAGQPLSQFILVDALNHVASFSDGGIPPVQAVISPENLPSQAMAEAQGFVMLDPPTMPDRLYVRPRNLKIDTGLPPESGG